MEEEKMETNQSSEDHFSQFMFGTKRKADQSEPSEFETGTQPSINYEELMIHIDTLMESAKNLKPLFQKVYPFVEQIWKKK
jgi:hypothetical protein